MTTAVATYEITGPTSYQFLENQPAINLSDEFDDQNQLVNPTDFFAFRPKSDVTVLADAVTPDGKAQTSWLAGIKVRDAEVILKVHGPRCWQQKNGSWSLSEGKPIASLPLHYAHSYGGEILEERRQNPDLEQPVDVCRFNPIGPGVPNGLQVEDDQEIKAPQVEFLDDPISDPSKEYEPAGLAPIAPVWRFRQQYSGTYDDTWLKTQHPFFPRDFDFAFYNLAHPRLQFKPMLKGGESVHLKNLCAQWPDIRFDLPTEAYGTVGFRRSKKTERLQMIPDGVYFDLRPTSERKTMKITYRNVMRWGGPEDPVDALFVGKIEPLGMTVGQAIEKAEARK